MGTINEILSELFKKILKILNKDKNGRYYMTQANADEILAFLGAGKDNTETLQSEGYHFFGEHTYKIIKTKSTWALAKKACEELGGHLVDILSQEEEDFIESIIDANTIYHLGGYSPAGATTSKTDWEWVTGEAWNYTHWKSSEPGKTSDYLCFWNDGTKEWHDGNIGTTAQYICEWGRDFRDEYASYGGHTFKYFEDSLTWHDAKAACEKLGGHLATSTSAEKNAFLFSLCRGAYAWLGGTDEAQEGVWEWVNGEEWDYTNWRSGEPNNSAGVEHYLHFYDSSGGWNDLRTTSKRTYICEWDEDITFNIDHEQLFNLLGGTENGHYHLSKEQMEQFIALTDGLTETYPPIIYDGQKIYCVEREVMTPYDVQGENVRDDSFKNITSMWSSQNLPAGVSLDAGTGMLSGTPSMAGEYAVSVKVVTNYGQDQKNIKIVVEKSTTDTDFSGCGLYLIGTMASTWGSKQAVDDDGFHIVDIPAVSKLCTIWNGFAAKALSNRWYVCGGCGGGAYFFGKTSDVPSGFADPFAKFVEYPVDGISDITAAAENNYYFVYLKDNGECQLIKTWADSQTYNGTVVKLGRSNLNMFILVKDDNSILFFTTHAATPRLTTHAVSEVRAVCGIYFPKGYATQERLYTAYVTLSGELYINNTFKDSYERTLSDKTITGLWVGDYEMYAQSSDGVLYVKTGKNDFSEVGSYRVKKISGPFMLTEDGRLYHKGIAMILLGITETHSQFTQIFPSKRFRDFAYEEESETLAVILERE